MIDDANDDKLYLVLEYAHKGQIMDYDLREKKFKPTTEGRAFYSEREV